MITEYRISMGDVKELQLYKDLDNEQIRHQRTLEDKINTTYLNEVPFDPEKVNKNYTDKDFKSEEGKISSLLILQSECYMKVYQISRSTGSMNQV
jgi:hypothetical protein